MSEQPPPPIDVDDPGLTAYALGELEGTELARYAAAVTSSLELQAIVAEIQAEARLITDELAREPQIPIAAERRIEIAVHAEKSQPVAAIPVKPRPLFTRRTMTIAASIALIPGAWYAFQFAFPRAHLRPVVASQLAPSSQTYYDAVEVQFRPQTPASQKPESVTESLLARPEHMLNGPGAGVQAVRTPTAEPDGESKSEPASAPLGSTPLKRSGREISLEDQIADAPASPRYAVPLDTSAASSESNQGLPSRSERYGKSAAGGRLGFLKNRDPKVAPPATNHPLPTSGAAVANEAKPHRPMLLLAEESRKEAVRKSNRPAGPKSDKGTTGERSPEDKKSEAAPAKELQELLAGTKLRPTKSERELREDKLALAPSNPATVDFTDESLDGQPERVRLKIADPTSAEAYKPIFENAFITPQEQQLSTFSIDVDTASYSNLRRFLQGGQLPPPDAVRIEELVNYFAYQYPQPQDGRPFSVQTDIAACPWKPGHQLVRIGLKGKEIPKEQRTATNLVFLVDVSGSMQAQNKLPLVRESLTTLVNQLDERDKVAIVTYAGEAGLRLPSTSVAKREVVLAAIASLGAGGSTNGAAGINTAYDIAAQEFIEKGTNRVILCTDGDFNVGVTSNEALVEMIQTRAKGGVFLSVFGFGMGNLKDDKLEELADKGNGQYGYIDDQQEANKVFVQELMGTLVTIAKDVKIQIDFNPETVASYRLVGYENRVMAAEDFHNDKKDAGEIGAGHTVTALYEIVPTKELVTNDQTRWLTVKLRYKQPEAATSVLFENPLVGQPGQLKLASSDFQFAASVAACGMLLRHSQHAGQANWGLVKELAQSGLSYDPHGHRRAFLGLVSQAESLMGQLRPVPPPATDSTVGGKYKSLLRRLHAPGDTEKYGQFNDYGHADTKSYAGSDNLPEGYWVYAAPYWYIWAETTQKATN